MTRLPVPGQDDGAWGDILNEFLKVEHNADGTLKKADDISAAQATADSKYEKPSGGIPKSDLANDVQNTINSLSYDTSNYAMSVGQDTTFGTPSDYAVAVGGFAYAAVYATALGTAANAFSQGSVAIGLGAATGDATTGGLDSVSIGSGSSTGVGASRSVALGGAASAAGTQAVAVGGQTAAATPNAVAIGALAVVDTVGASGTALGVGAHVAHAQSTAVGQAASTTAANQVRLGTAAEHVSIPGKYIALTTEQSSQPAAPAAGAVLFVQDNGSGKTQLCVRFPTGAVQIIATEP